MQYGTDKLINPGEINSTNSYALELLSRERPAEESVIITDNQIHGRGLGSNSWESEPGKNLTFSMILYPDFVEAHQQFTISMAISIGLLQGVQILMPEYNELKIKWPNDIYAGDKKLSGMLIQHAVIKESINYTIAGIGLNVNQIKFSEDVPNPVSMAMIAGQEFDLKVVLGTIRRSIHDVYTMLQKDIDAHHKSYYELMYRYKEWHSYIIRQEERSAMIKGINEFGQLVLLGRDDEEWICDLKEISYII